MTTQVKYKLNKTKVIPIDSLALSWGSPDISPIAGWRKLPQLAKSLNVLSIREDPEVEEAFVRRREDSGFEISVNANHPVVRKRFALAHEVAHLLLDINLVRAGRPSSVRPVHDDYGVEKKCDDIAAGLLMPEKSFLSAMKQNAMSLGSLTKISRQFGTSIEATAIRLTELSDRSFVILKIDRLSGSHKELPISWAATSRNSKDSTGKRHFIGKGANAFGVEAVRRAAYESRRVMTKESVALGTINGEHIVEAKRFGLRTADRIFALIRCTETCTAAEDVD